MAQDRFWNQAEKVTLHHDLIYIDLRHYFILTFNQIHHFQLNLIETDYFSFLLQIYFPLRSPSIEQWLENLLAAVPLTDAH